MLVHSQCPPMLILTKNVINHCIRVRVNSWSMDSCKLNDTVFGIDLAVRPENHVCHAKKNHVFVSSGYQNDFDKKFHQSLHWG